MSTRLTKGIWTAMLALLVACSKGGASIDLLNVSYDPTRELYAKINTAFARDYKAKTGKDVVVLQSHGGSGKQARSVIEGLEGDVVTLGLGYDVDAVAKAGLVKSDWRSRFPNGAVPFSSTVVFLVREGNPKHIHDWSDLVKDDVAIITANPKTSGGARWVYLAAWGYAKRLPNGSDASAEAFVKELYHHVPVLDSGARGATTTFVERGMGDVLLAWENEALLGVARFKKDHLEMVVPSVSIRADPPIAIVAAVVDHRGTRAEAEAYLRFLYTDEAQAIAAESYFRPTDPKALAAAKDEFAPIPMFTIDDVFGGWDKAQRTHFADGGVFDRIYGGAP